jgi:hypothetical protein
VAGKPHGIFETIFELAIASGAKEIRQRITHSDRRCGGEKIGETHFVTFPEIVERKIAVR